MIIHFVLTMYFSHFHDINSMLLLFRVKELEAELEKYRNENAILEKQLAEYQQLHGNVTNFHNRPSFHHVSRLPSTSGFIYFLLYQ